MPIALSTDQVIKNILVEHIYNKCIDLHRISLVPVFRADIFSIGYISYLQVNLVQYYICKVNNSTLEFAVSTNWWLLKTNTYVIISRHNLCYSQVHFSSNSSTILPI